MAEVLRDHRFAQAVAAHQNEIAGFPEEVGREGAVNDVALALVGQPPDKIDEGVETMLRMLVEGLLGQPSPPSQTFVDGIVVVCREMIRERITELQSSGSGQA